MYSDVINTFALLVSILSLIGFTIIERESLATWFRKTFPKLENPNVPKEKARRKSIEISLQSLFRVPSVRSLWFRRRITGATIIPGSILLGVFIELFFYFTFIAIQEKIISHVNLVVCLPFFLILFSGPAIGYVQSILAVEAIEERAFKCIVGFFANIITFGLGAIIIFLGSLMFNDKYLNIFFIVWIAIAGALTGLIVGNAVEPDI